MNMNEGSIRGSWVATFISIYKRGIHHQGGYKTQRRNKLLLLRSLSR
jgi:hypothetical protein